jgi:hypothetical protein
MTASPAYPGKQPNRFIDGSALAVLVVLALGLRFYGITGPAIWYDEAFSVLLARHDPWQIWSITARDVHPPLYYLALHYWITLFGDGVLAVRSLSAVIDVGTVLLSIKLMSLVATRRATWIAALLVALLPISVRYSQEARMYTLLGFWLMGATVALVCWVKEPESRRFAAIYVLLMTSAFYTHYFAALTVLVHWVYWWWGRPGKYQAVLPVRLWILVNGAIVVLFLPWLPHFFDQLSGRHGLDWIPPITLQAALSLVWQLTLMQGGQTHSLYVQVLPLMAVAASAVMLVWKDNTLHRFNGLLAGYFFIPAVVLALIALVIPTFVTRYLVFAAVGVPLIIALALDRWAPRFGVLALAGLIALAAELLGLQSVYQQTDGLNGTDLRSDYRLDKMAAYIKQVALPGDGIILDDLLWYLPFVYYNETGIRPTLYVYEPRDSFLRTAEHGGAVFFHKNFEWVYFNDPQLFKCHGNRVWLIAPTLAADVRLLFEKNWKPSVVFNRNEMSAFLFVPKTIPASTEAGIQAALKQPPPLVAQNCPPAPSATSASKTPH